MPNRKLKWPQIMAIIAPQALQFLAEEFVLAYQRGTKKEHNIRRITFQVGTGEPTVISRQQNQIDRRTPPEV